MGSPPSVEFEFRSLRQFATGDQARAAAARGSRITTTSAGISRSAWSAPWITSGRWRERELGRALPSGIFGENPTTAGLDVNGALIGERWRIGHDVILEVSCPRIPCVTFQGWLERDGWIKQFTQAVRPGTYLRVIQPGDVRAADPIEIVHRPGHDLTVALAFRAMTREPDLLPLLVTADALPEDDKEMARRRTST